MEGTWDRFGGPGRRTVRVVPFILSFHPAKNKNTRALSLANFEFSLAVLAALLTVIGFSVNDRIVMYDRLREIRE